ncbi:hypothetical protein F441_09720 [Phytophthora nicotianae CJ01A1]|uniref:Uncharacterized protein n=3 Tax=Phytophthora nicotianae TaxID=4792 RepID=V9F5U3_PHYNI|nr:hypothetical protein F443_09778 [Phytophthora nicotianae P1569]ETM45522.1 hypothetical protein L914_09450 [Phytophthora nicotianae]ETP15543.1 hypothetical protein F441_09720 [Phytophthora nicotianae CJ01A1]
MVASCYYFAAMASLATLSQLHTTTATSVLPSIKLGFNVHRSTMAMYSFISFDIYVKPVVTGNDVIFDGKATFEQDGVTHNFYLIDGVPFHEVVTGSSDLTACLPVDNIPSVSDIFEAVASATPVSNVNTDQEISCNNGTWLSTTYAGEPYVLCTTEAEANGGNFIVYGEDLSVSFEFLSDEVNITKPVHSPSNCQAAPHDSVELSSLDLLYGITSKNSRRALTAEARTAHLASSTCACRGTSRPCLFFHGMDVTKDGAIVDEYSFFGDIKKHAPCCSSFHFAVLNTVGYEWYNDTLQQKACDAAMNVTTGRTDSEASEINDLIVVAHSMGNSMLAGALASGKCSIGRNVDWVALSGPMKGSMGSDFLYQVCGVDGNADTILSKFGGLIGQCPGTTTRRSLVYDGGVYCDTECSLRYAAARAMHKKYVTAGVCGTTSNGLLSKEYAGLLVGGLIIPHHSSNNDGIVELQSCVGDLDPSKFDTTYASTWYAAKLNHADTTFHNGDALFSSAQKPLKWFECLL